MPYKCWKLNVLNKCDGKVQFGFFSKYWVRKLELYQQK